MPKQHSYQVARKPIRKLEKNLWIITLQQVCKYALLNNVIDPNELPPEGVLLPEYFEDEQDYNKIINKLSVWLAEILNDNPRNAEYYEKLLSPPDIKHSPFNITFVFVVGFCMAVGCSVDEFCSALPFRKPNSYLTNNDMKLLSAKMQQAIYHLQVANYLDIAKEYQELEEQHQHNLANLFSRYDLREADIAIIIEAVKTSLEGKAKPSEDMILKRKSHV